MCNCLRFRFFPVSQQMPRHEKRIGDYGGDHRAANDRCDQMRVLRLVNNVVIQSEQGRDGAECKPRGHHEGVVQAFLALILESSYCGQ